MKILKIIFLGEIDFKIKLKFFFRYGTNIHVRKIFMSYGDMSFVAHFVIIKNLKRTSEEKKTLNDRHCNLQFNDINSYRGKIEVRSTNGCTLR